MDGQVARPDDPELKELLSRFVCVRCIQAWGIDLTRFRFDNGQSWCAFVLNAADGTVYGRYGTRSAPDASLYNSLEGFKKALKASLELHAKYPGSRSLLDGKKSRDSRWRFPEIIPENQGRFEKLKDSRKGCLCCHLVQSGELLSYRSLGAPVDDSDLWVFPMPDLLGLSLDPAETATVRAVAAGSEAESAGFRAGDKILSADGEPVISIADIQYALHVSKEPSKLAFKVDRGGAAADLSLSLPKHWRQRGEFSWRRATWPLRHRALGFAAEALPESDGAALGLSAGTPALRVTDVTQPNVQGGNQDARLAGLQKGDVIVEVDGRKAPSNESRLIAYVFQNKPPGTKLQLTLLDGRGRKRISFAVR